MDVVKELIPLAIQGSLALLVLVVGLDAPPSYLLSTLRAPRRLLAAGLAATVIMPVAAIALLHLIPIGRAALAGIVLMAISPAPALVPGKLVKMTGRKDYAYGLYAALVLLSVIVVPIWVVVARYLFSADVAIPPTAVLRNVAGGVLAPLAIGALVHRLAPKLASAAAPILYKLGLALLYLGLMPIIIYVWPAMVALTGDGTLLVMVLSVIVAFIGGALLGGSDFHDRTAFSAAASARHPGIALLIARSNFDDPNVAAAIVAFLLVGLLVSIPCHLLLKRACAGT